MPFGNIREKQQQGSDQIKFITLNQEVKYCIKRTKWKGSEEKAIAKRNNSEPNPMKLSGTAVLKWPLLFPVVLEKQLEVSSGNIGSLTLCGALAASMDLLRAAPAI